VFQWRSMLPTALGPPPMAEMANLGPSSPGRKDRFGTQTGRGAPSIRSIPAPVVANVGVDPRGVGESCANLWQ
jgi:hypothetical protein